MRKRIRLRVKEAQTTNNGIYFFSNKYPNYATLTTIDKNGQITIMWTDEIVQESSYSDEKAFEIQKRISFIVLLLFASGIWTAFKNSSNIPGISELRAVLVICVIGVISVFAGYVFRDRKNRRIKRLHGTEHMCVNAYNDLGRVPTLDEVKKYSRYNPNCSTNLHTKCVFISFLCFLCTYIPNIVIMIIAMIGVIFFIRFLTRQNLLNFLQYFTTSEPTDRELLGAIEGMHVWAKHEMEDWDD